MALLGKSQQRYITKYACRPSAKTFLVYRASGIIRTRQPPHILIFYVTPIRPLVYLDPERIPLSFSASHNITNVKFRSIAASLAVPNLFPIYPDMVSAVHSFESKSIREAAIDLPVSWDREVRLVQPSWIVRWRIWRMCWKWIIEVGVVRMAVALQLPSSYCQESETRDFKST